MNWEIIGLGPRYTNSDTGACTVWLEGRKLCVAPVAGRGGTAWGSTGGLELV